jgi:glycosyltransferase involved in cell wall biosynthesis
MRHQTDLHRLLRSPLIRHFAPDVVVSESVSGLYVGHALARLRRAVHVHNDHRQVGMPLSGRREAMVRLLARRLDWVILVSDAQADSWVSDRGCQPDRITVIANGVQAPNGATSRAEVRAALHLPDTAVVALLVATLRAEKRARDFVAGVARARQSNPDLVGLVVGDGPERASVQAAAQGEDAIRLLGHRDDVPELMQAADIFVLTSEYEAVPMAILEAMAAGLPVVATRVGDIPSVIDDGEHGWLVAPGDVDAIAARLVELAGDPQRRAALGAAAVRRHAERYDAETMIDRYAEFLRRAALDRGPRR